MVATPQPNILVYVANMRPVRRRKALPGHQSLAAVGTSLGHAKKKQQRRKKNEQRMGPVFVVPPIPARGAVNHYPAAEHTAEAHQVPAAGLQDQEDFIPFGLADDYEFYAPTPKRKKEPTPPDAAAEREYAKWNTLVPKLIEPILRYNQQRVKTMVTATVPIRVSLGAPIVRDT
ncbi:hypothetical protein AURDEDRAFT_131893 [Auricularia subglabra TFB-10046 SS5]|uniref:Uncharacterized protein n=1 Tax=Auricularia subglabra (strain TFB-10046 / SS5) TaxID=717982 RepID=J0CRZ8_AURST|nr:hypothetical protein AURDEDRAFT_131893 [Auricularia subglabra TFB-10046 SS5]